MQYIILHGSFGSSKENWFPWLSKQLSKDGHEVFSIDFPIEDWNEMTKLGKGNCVIRKQNLASWLDHFSKNILPNIDKSQEIGIVAHSLAPNFMLHLLQDLELKCAITISVAPFYEELPDVPWQIDAVNFPFREKRYDWRHIKNSAPNSYVLYSENDPYVESKYSLKFAKKINANTIKVKGAGHFNTESGWGKAPLVLELCRTV